MNYKVLIVDDSKLARMAIAKALSALRPTWTRIEAKDADEALALVTGDTSVHMALLDFNMPKRDGLALAAELHDLRPGMPLALVSANHQEEVVRRARDVGADFLPKPVTERALAAFLDSAALRLEKAPR